MWKDVSEKKVGSNGLAPIHNKKIEKKWRNFVKSQHTSEFLPYLRMIKYKSASIFCHIWFEKRATRLCKKTLQKEWKKTNIWSGLFDFLFQNCAAARKLQKFFFLLLLAS